MFTGFSFSVQRREGGKRADEYAYVGEGGYETYPIYHFRRGCRLDAVAF